MRKVFEVQCDLRGYRALALCSRNELAENSIVLDSRQVLQTWTPLEVYSPEPHLPAPDFWHLTVGSFAVSERVAKVIRPVVGGDCEFLPLLHGTDRLYLVNVLRCIDCLDYSKTKWKWDKTGSVQMGIERYAFVNDRLESVGLFKIPESARTRIFFCEVNETGFRSLVIEHGFTGLLFDER